jgi:predicted Na+-dependent transporter
VAAVGLVALAGADATVALGVVTGSLVLAALVGPVAIGWLSASAAHFSSGHLLVRFALVVLVPLLAGVAVRSRPALAARLASADAEREGIAALIVAVLVYAALSGTHAGRFASPRPPERAMSRRPASPVEHAASATTAGSRQYAARA